MRYQIFWDIKDNEVRNFFGRFMKQNYEGVRFQYDWGKDWPEIEVYLMRLLLSSHVNAEDKVFCQQLPTYISDVEKFFVCGIRQGLFSKHNIDRILEDFSTGFRVIEFLPVEMRGCYGASVDDKIQINPNMNPHANSPELNAEEIRMLYMFHEMGHKILNVHDIQFITKYCDSFKPIMKEKGSDYISPIFIPLISAGFLLIEETLSQEMAERFVYDFAHKKRPPRRIENDLGCHAFTNFDYYGIFQQPVINLGKTLRGCGVNATDSYGILTGMLRRALFSSFSPDLIAEYNGSPRLYHDLYMILQHMGNILNEKYASFGFRQFPTYSVPVSQSLNSIKSLTDKNADFRDYPLTGFTPVDFDFHLKMRPIVTKKYQ